MDGKARPTIPSALKPRRFCSWCLTRPISTPSTAMPPTSTLSLITLPSTEPLSYLRGEGDKVPFHRRGDTFQGSRVSCVQPFGRVVFTLNARGYAFTRRFEFFYCRSSTINSSVYSAKFDDLMVHRSARPASGANMGHGICQMVLLPCLFDHTTHLLLKFLPMGTAVEEARASNAECKPQLAHPTPGTHVSELPVSNRIFRRRARKYEEALAASWFRYMRSAFSSLFYFIVSKGVSSG